MYGVNASRAACFTWSGIILGRVGMWYKYAVLVLNSIPMLLSKFYIPLFFLFVLNFIIVIRDRYMSYELCQSWKNKTLLNMIMEITFSPIRNCSYMSVASAPTKR